VGQGAVAIDETTPAGGRTDQAAAPAAKASRRKAAGAAAAEASPATQTAPEPAQEQQLPDGVYGRYAGSEEAEADEEAKPAKGSRRGRKRGAAAPGQAVAQSIATGDSDLWQLVDPSASASVPAAGEKRSFDAVSVFLTVLVAVVIVALLLGFLVFAGGVLGR
jgi:hypothetical protein